jgi:NUMOD4 motif
MGGAKTKVELKKNAKIVNLKGERWKEIKNFPSYKISNRCRVQNIETGRLIKQSIKTTKYGDKYKVVMLRKKSGKETTAMMHRLMADHFVDNPNEYEYIKHIDGDRYNNEISNIEWVDRDIIYK